MAPCSAKPRSVTPPWRDDGDFATDKGFGKPLSNAKYRDIYRGTLMAAGGFTPASAAEAVAAGTYDLVAFGRWFLSNPDLPERIRTGAQLNVYDRDTFYHATIDGGGDDWLHHARKPTRAATSVSCTWHR